MPLDAVCLQAVVKELREQVLDTRIDKVHQPARDQVILLLRGPKRLVLNAGANAPRLQLTEQQRDNPAEPPMFCMLLRKHLVGGRITALIQPAMERLVELEIDITDEFGRQGRRYLVLEAMGRHSNLILLDEERRIVECLRRVDAEMSPQRQVLPGLFYQRPPTHGKTYLTDVTEELFRALLASANPERQLDAFLLDSFFGLSPLVARELAFETTGATDSHLFALSEEGVSRFWACVQTLQEQVRRERFTPVCLMREEKPLDFSYMSIAQYGPGVREEIFPSFSALMDRFYTAREREEQLRQRGADLLRTVTTVHDRLTRKLALQEKDYAATQDRDALRICGDLLTANFYRMERGLTSFTAENFYDETGGTLTIALDPLLTPQQNAARYYKRYAKARTAEKYLREQMELARRESAYLESVLEELREAETEQDFQDIRGELRDGGYLRGGRTAKKEQRPSKPREFHTSGGFRVLVGRSNRQNDLLTGKLADRRDLWFHTQKIHGSHVILCTGGTEVPESDVAEAAALAAWYSQARESANVPVDWTTVKNVKKPAGARPGMVTYTAYRTVAVTPDGAAVERMAGRGGKAAP